MSYKRRRVDSLTGGTKDVNPQYMNLKGTQSAADTYTQFTFPVPIQRLQSMNRAQVMEVLKVFFNTTNIITTAAAQTSASITIQLTTKTQAAAVTLDEPTLFAQYEKNSNEAFTAAGSYQSVQQEPYVWDCTDGAGHGVLVASDNIFLGIASIQTGVPVLAQVKILYRWKDVNISEYVGIVQSQS